MHRNAIDLYSNLPEALQAYTRNEKSKPTTATGDYIYIYIYIYIIIIISFVINM